MNDKDQAGLKKVFSDLDKAGFEAIEDTGIAGEIRRVFVNEESDQFAVVKFNRSSDGPAMVASGSLHDSVNPYHAAARLSFVTADRYLARKL